MVHDVILTWQSCSLVCFSSMSILSADSSKAELRFSLSAISWWTFFSRSFFRLVTRSISSRRISRWVTWSCTVILLSVTWSRSWLMRLANSCSLEAEAWSKNVFINGRNTWFWLLQLRGTNLGLISLIINLYIFNDIGLNSEIQNLAFVWDCWKRANSVKICQKITMFEQLNNQLLVTPNISLTPH